MIRNLILFSCLIFLSYCGGSGGDHKQSMIEGRWRGDILQGVIICSNGNETFGIGAGAGTVVGKVDLEVYGSDEIGTSVQVTDGSCYLEGLREEAGFQANAISGCPPELVSITFTLLEKDSAGVGYKLKEQVSGDNNETICRANDYAQVER